MTSKIIRSEIVTTLYEGAQRVWRTVDVVDGDVSGTMVVPSVEAAQDELKRDWKKFTDALNTHAKTLTMEQRDAIYDAATTIESSTRWVATAALFAALSATNDAAIGTYFTVPYRRTAMTVEEVAAS